MVTSYEAYQIKTFSLGIYNYCYTVVDKTTRTAVLVDPAWELNKITDRLNQSEAQLDAVLLTHSHFDHINLVEPLLRLYNPDIYMSRKEIDYYKFRCRNLYELDDSDEITVGGTEISCILTPGHTTGGMCYLLSDRIFTGDTVFTEGCGVCNTRGGSAGQMFDSFQKIKSIVPSHVRVYPAHSFGMSPGQSLGHLLNNNIYFQIDKKEYFINFRMRKNQRGLFDFK
ncbi:MAG: MBL fold metallo-hydrolase [Clostridia bacterium]|nr:MBL fold metallo-hydrolase [Clostridia bacterium]